MQGRSSYSAVQTLTGEPSPISLTTSFRGPTRTEKQFSGTALKQRNIVERRDAGEKLAKTKTYAKSHAGKPKNRTSRESPRKNGGPKRA